MFSVNPRQAAGNRGSQSVRNAVTSSSSQLTLKSTDQDVWLTLRENAVRPIPLEHTDEIIHETDDIGFACQTRLDLLLEPLI